MSKKEEKKDQKAKTDATATATTTTTATKPEGQQMKIEVFEEDDYFEEFETESSELKRRDTGDFRQWQEAWEDEEINDHFDTILKKELDSVKNIPAQVNKTSNNEFE